MASGLVPTTEITRARRGLAGLDITMNELPYSYDPRFSHHDWLNLSGNCA